MLSKNVKNKKCAPKLIFFNEKKIEKDSDDFWSRKFTLNVRFWHFLTPPHYTNLQNSMISFDFSWFLAKNLSNFVSLPWKLHNRYCHRNHTTKQKKTLNKSFWPSKSGFEICKPRVILARNLFIYTYISSLHCVEFILMRHNLGNLHA